MATKSLFFLLTIISLMMMSTYSSREFPPPIPGLFNLTGPGGLEALDCLTSLYRIRSCSNEIAAYFADGKIDITPPCCQAIAVITHNCWPAVLRVLGYTPDQTYILRGYCDAAAAADGLGPVSSPAGQPLPAGN